MKLLLPLFSLGILIVGCTPYGAKKEPVHPIKEYREELTSDYTKEIKQTSDEEITENLEKVTYIDPLIDIHNMWWYKQIQEKKSEKDIHVTLTDLYARSLRHSDQVRVLADIPIIRSTTIEETKGSYDPVVYAEGGYNRINEPVGNVLKTGNANDFKENELYFKTGVRKKFAPGTQVDISEKFQRIQNNSEFTDPNAQTIATLNISVIQPLLRGAGIEYNEGWLRLAELDTEVAKNEYKRQLERHLFDITKSYWSLYVAQGNSLLRNKMLENIQVINNEMKQRQNFDALQSQIYHTEAALSFHRAQIIRGKSTVENAQDRLLALINDPELTERNIDHVIPKNIPYTKWIGTNLKQSMLKAISNRPELEQSYLQIRSSTIRLNMAKNELLPILDGIVEVAMSGLEADNDLGGAISEEFSGSDPGVRLGFRFEYPIWNRVARARHLRRQLEKRQLINQFKTTINSILFEVELSIREVETTYQEYTARQKAYLAANNEIESLKKRRVLETILNSERGTSVYLQALLQSQNNYLETQFQLLKSLVDYNLAISNLKKSEGTFLAFEKMKNTVEEDENGLPVWKTVLQNYEEKYDGFYNSK